MPVSMNLAQLNWAQPWRLDCKRSCLYFGSNSYSTQLSYSCGRLLLIRTDWGPGNTTKVLLVRLKCIKHWLGRTIDELQYLDSFDSLDTGSRRVYIHGYEI